MNQDFNNIDRNNLNSGNSTDTKNQTLNNNLNVNNVHAKNVQSGFKEILEIVLTGIILFAFIFLLFNKKTNNTQLLEKYTYSFSENEINISNVKIETKNITKEQMNLNLNNEFVSLYIPYSNYEVAGKRQTFVNEPNNTVQDFYKSIGDVEQRVAISFTKDGYKDLTSLNIMFEKFKKEYNEISLDDFLKRNNINDEMDFELSILKNKDKKVNKYSTKEEIIDKFVLDYFTDYLLSSQIEFCDKLILLTGDVEGYVWKDENTIIIELKNKTNDYNIEISSFYGNKINLKDEDIIDMISSIKFNI